MQCTQQNVFAIYLGDSQPLNLKALYASDLSPLDLTSCTEIDISLPNADGSFSHLLLSLDQVSIVSPPVLGGFGSPSASIGSISALLNVGELQTFTVAFTISGAKQTVAYVNALSVFEQP